MGKSLVSCFFETQCIKEKPQTDKTVFLDKNDRFRYKIRFHELNVVLHNKQSQVCNWLNAIYPCLATASQTCWINILIGQMPFPKPDLLIYNISYVFDSNSIILLRYKDCYYSLYFLGVGYFRLHCMMRRHCILELIHNPVALNCILSRDFIWISELLSCRLCPVFFYTNMNKWKKVR